MANSSSPFRRTGENSWEDLLNQVNFELQNPPEDTDCEPIDEIPTPEPCHRWAKSDIREVHDKLDEMDTDCFDFEDIPDLWKVSIITDIESQLPNAWCDCDDDEICCEPCSNARDLPTFVIEFLGSFPKGGLCCTPASSCPTCKFLNDPGPTVACAEDICDELEQPEEIYQDFVVAHGERCVLDNEVEALEDELEALEDAKAACIENANTPEEVIACQATFDPQIDAKQTELDEKKTERDAKIAEENGLKGEYVAAGQAREECYIDCASTCGSTGGALEELGPTSGPGFDDTCIDPCCGNVVGDCRVSWSLRMRQSNDFKPNDFGPFASRIGGFYDADGTVVVTFHASPFCYCLPDEFGCACTRFEGGTGGLPCSSCFGGGLTCRDGGEPGRGFQEWERIDFHSRTFTPFDCINGGPCDGV